jgi:rRNA maturation endonuclease Nob1
MATLAAPSFESNIPPTRADLFPCAVRRWKRSRRMELHCENCRTVTKRNVQALKWCPVCGVPMLVLEPGKPHRRAKAVQL